MIDRRALALVAALVVAAVPLPARAQAHKGEPSAAAAQAQFEAAIALYDKKDYTTALARFREAHAATHSPNARLYVARSLRELGRVGEAYDEMKATLDEASARAATEPRYAKTRDAVAAELAVLERSVAFLTVTVEGAQGGLEVRLAGDVLAVDKLGKVMALKPGHVTLSAAAPGKVTITREVELAGGQRQTVAIAFGDAAAAPVIASAPPVDAGSPPPSGGGAVRKIGFGFAGLGLAGGVVFAVTGSMARSKYDEVNKACGGVRCTDPKFADEISTGRTLTTVANIGLVTGIVGVAAAVPMIVFGGPHAAPKSVAIAPAGQGVAVVGAF